MHLDTLLPRFAGSLISAMPEYKKEPSSLHGGKALCVRERGLGREAYAGAKAAGCSIFEKELCP